MNWTELDTAIAWHIDVTRKPSWTKWLAECLTCRKPVAGTEPAVWGWAIHHVETQHLVGING